MILNFLLLMFGLFFMTVGLFTIWTLYSWFRREKIPMDFLVGSNKVNLHKEFQSHSKWLSFKASFWRRKPPPFYLQLNITGSCQAFPNVIEPPSAGCILGFHMRNEQSLWMWVQTLPENMKCIRIDPSKGASYNLHPYKEKLTPTEAKRRKFNEQNKHTFFILKKSQGPFTLRGISLDQSQGTGETDIKWQITAL